MSRDALSKASAFTHWITAEPHEHQHEEISVNKGGARWLLPLINCSEKALEKKHLLSAVHSARVPPYMNNYDVFVAHDVLQSCVCH